MIILVTGGSSGLGEAITRRLALDVNNTVCFTYNNSQANAQKLESEFKNTFSIKCDFKNHTEVENLAAQFEKLQIEVLINNAYTGDAIKTYFHKIPNADFLSGFTDNVVPTVLLTQAAITQFRKKKFGKIITISTSFLVNTPPLGSAVYVANKAYIEQLTKIWAIENAKYNITSNNISPAFMLTGFTNDTDERILEQMTIDHPLKAILTTTEVAESVNFLVNATQQINGTNIVINAATNIK